MQIRNATSRRRVQDDHICIRGESRVRFPREEPWRGQFGRLLVYTVEQGTPRWPTIILRSRSER